MKKVVSICDVEQHSICKNHYGGYCNSVVVDCDETKRESVYVVKFPFLPGSGVDAEITEQYLEKLGGDIITVVMCRQ